MYVEIDICTCKKNPKQSLVMNYDNYKKMYFICFHQQIA